MSDATWMRACGVARHAVLLVGVTAVSLGAARGEDLLKIGVAISQSGTFVREIATLGGDVSKFVSPSVLDRLRMRVKTNVVSE